MMSLYYKSVVYLSVVMEELHRIAFRNALSNPLYCPSFNISKHSHDDVSVGNILFILLLYRIIIYIVFLQLYTVCMYVA